MLFCIPGGVLSTQYYYSPNTQSVHIFVCSLVSQLALNKITISAPIGFHDCFYCQDYRKVQLHCSFDELSIHHLLSGVPIQWFRFRIIRKLHSHFTLTMFGSYCMVTDLLTNKFRQVDGHSKIDSDLDQLKSNSGMTLRSNTELNQTKLLNSWHSTKKHSPTIISIEISTLFTEWPEPLISFSVEGSLLLTEVLIRYPLIVVGILGLWSLILVFVFVSVFVACWYLPPSRAPLLLTLVLSPSCGLVRTRTSVLWGGTGPSTGLRSPPAH